MEKQRGIKRRKNEKIKRIRSREGQEDREKELGVGDGSGLGGWGEAGNHTHTKTKLLLAQSFNNSRRCCNCCHAEICIIITATALWHIP